MVIRMSLFFTLLFTIIGVMLTIYGIYLAFSASIILGIVVFILEPAPLVLAIIALIARPDICEAITRSLSLPF